MEVTAESLQGKANSTLEEITNGIIARASRNHSARKLYGYGKVHIGETTEVELLGADTVLHLAPYRVP